MEGVFSAEVNDTTLVLIPKKNNVDDPKDLRPIVLCNVLYKILAKVLANRLQKILPTIISEEQSVFFPGRNITDNVLVAFEILHYMKRKNSGPEGEVALKLDISKAYDRVNWNYLRSRMINMGFLEKWIKWVMLCVTTVSYSISFQGSLIGPMVPTRGLRQGDPLSPYLFLLCTEGLSNALKTAAEEGQTSGCRICTNAPSVTHLLFADDSFLLFKATANEALTVKSVLNTYQSWSGQDVNYQKSAIFFSSNVRMDKQQEIKQMLEVFNDIGDSKYLGLPSLIGRSKKLVFKYLKEKVIQRIKGWSIKLLSRAARRSGGASYTWSGIWEAKEEMKKGLRWVLGDGDSINIGGDKWLRSSYDFCVNYIATSDLAKHSKVREFFKDNRREWDVEKVNLHFSPEDAAAIVNTRIPQGCTSDRSAWVHTSNGQYTVKSAFSKECWQLVGLDFEAHDIEYVSEWLVSFLASGPVANNKHVPTHTYGDTTDESDHKWKKPGEGKLKINVDASVMEGHGFFAVGMVIRDHHGQFIAWRTLKFAGAVSVTEAESTGILEALIWAQEMTEGTILVESDSLISVNAIKQNQSNLLELGDVWRAVKQ
ncbi:uncharacterized protein LOC141691390 [Apium graveolens]|uniref:uncharacterized protein LOC141691390 n=1 Tax=Apium graveolens TaxID=4045 RepID=UPI003D79A1AF